MKYVLATAGFLALSSCSVADLIVAEKTLKVICGVSEVLLTEIESDKVTRAFGEESFGAKVCDLFAPLDAPASDTQPIGPQRVTIMLPVQPDGTKGELVTATIRPAH